MISELRNLAHPEFRVGELNLKQWAKGCNDHAYDDGAYLISALDRAAANYKYRPKVVTTGWN